MEGRLDSGFYKHYYLQILDTFEKSTCKFITLKTITKKIKTGTTPDQKLDAFTTEKEIPFLRNSDIQDGEIIEDKFKYIKNDLAKYLTFSYKNEIIICIAGTIGISALNRFDRLAINQNVSSLIIDETQININFLIYWLNTKVAISLLKRLASIATISYVNNPTLLRLQIPLPDINIQDEIVLMMSKAIEKQKEKQKEAQDLLDSIDVYLLGKLGIELPVEPENSIENRTFKVAFDNIFGDRLDADSYTSYYQNIFDTFEKSTCKFITLKTITKKIKTGTTPDQKLDAFTTEKEIPFLRNSDIQDGEIIEDKFKYIKNDLAKYLTFSYKNEIIICIAGTIGISALNRFDRLAINQNVSSLIIDETQININFLIYWLNTKVAISLLKRLASIATISYVNNPTLLRLQIPLPDINIQDEIANEIKQRREKAKQFQDEAKSELENAKKEVEKIILGESFEY